jgi:hypothetical protein
LLRGKGADEKQEQHGASHAISCCPLQRLLDELEACLGALGVPVLAPAPLVDFARLPALPLPGLAAAPHAAAVFGDSDTGTEGGPGSVHPTDDETGEEDAAQEELGDSTLEAQARGAAPSRLCRACKQIDDALSSAPHIPLELCTVLCRGKAVLLGAC